MWSFSIIQTIKFNRLLISSVQPLSHVGFCVTPSTAARQGFMSITNSWSLFKFIPLSKVYHATISSSLIPFSFCLQSFPESGSFPMSQLIASVGQRIGASASVLPVTIQGWFPLELAGLISLQSKGLPRVFSSTTIQKYKFFSSQPSLWTNFHIHTWPQEKPQPRLDEPLLAK